LSTFELVPLNPSSASNPVSATSSAPTLMGKASLKFTLPNFKAAHPNQDPPFSNSTTLVDLLFSLNLLN
jgi:hypothetical protein